MFRKIKYDAYIAFVLIICFLLSILLVFVSTESIGAEYSFHQDSDKNMCSICYPTFRDDLFQNTQIIEIVDKSDSDFAVHIDESQEYHRIFRKTILIGSDGKKVDYYIEIKYNF